MESSSPNTGQGTAVRSAAATDTAPAFTWSTIWRRAKAAGLNFSDINGTIWSASFAYYAFFALVPLLLLLVTLSTDVAAHFVGEQQAREQAFKYIVSNVDAYLPVSTAVQETIHSTVRGVMDARGKIGLVAFSGLLWSGMGFFQSLVSAINQAWGHHPLNWWKLPLTNLLMLGVVLSALLLGVIVPAVLGTVERYVTFGGALGVMALRGAASADPHRRVVLRVPAVLQAGPTPAGERHVFDGVDSRACWSPCCCRRVRVRSCSTPRTSRTSTPCTERSAE